MLDYSTKEFVRSFHWSNMGDERELIKTEIILGRTYYRIGRGTATTIVVDCWKVFDPSDKLFKYVYFGGVARQHPDDSEITLKAGLEIAEEKAFADPDFMFTFNEFVEVGLIINLMETYATGIKMQMIRTAEEKNILK